MTISGRWVALADWAIALIIAVPALAAGIGAFALALIPAGVFIWLGVKAYKSVDHW